MGPTRTLLRNRGCSQSSPVESKSVPWSALSSETEWELPVQTMGCSAWLPKKVVFSSVPYCDVAFFLTFCSKWCFLALVGDDVWEGKSNKRETV